MDAEQKRMLWKICAALIVAPTVPILLLFSGDMILAYWCCASLCAMVLLGILTDLLIRIHRIEWAAKPNWEASVVPIENELMYCWGAGFVISFVCTLIASCTYRTHHPISSSFRFSLVVERVGACAPPPIG